jgi:hypothetical protein
MWGVGAGVECWGLGFGVKVYQRERRGAGPRRRAGAAVMKDKLSRVSTALDFLQDDTGSELVG